MSEPPLPPDVIRFQLTLLDAYERLLEGLCPDEAKLNDALKSTLACFLPLLRAQRALGEQLLSAHRELIRQYRSTLETALRGRVEPG